MRRSRATADQIDAALAEVKRLDLEGLRRRWQALSGQPAPAALRAQLLRAAVGHSLQVRALGGLKPGTRSLLRRVAEQTDRQRSGSGQGAQSSTTRNDCTSQADSLQAEIGPGPFRPAAAVALSPPRVRRAATRIKPGTRVLRTWQGSTHEVLVGQGEVTYRGRRYRSLSEVAREITGQRWSGPLFFGLKRRDGDAR